MKVMVACEFSGRVRDAFLAGGHDAISCDILPTESPGPHIQDDIMSLDLSGYDLMIAFPPCTYLTKAGLFRNTDPARAQLTEDALDFVVDLLNAPVPRIALENPIGCISTRIRKPNQIIQPWQFGDSDRKATCLWLLNLPQLTPTQVLERPNEWAGQNLGKELGARRGLLRSLTYPGIAAAMAQQWGCL
jgi:hypothetical protein